MLRKLYYINICGLDCLEDVKVVESFESKKIVPPCYLFLDQATHTGFSLYDSDCQLVLVGQMVQSKDESIYNYTKELQKSIIKLVEKFKVKQIVYEETFLRASLSSKEVLDGVKFMVKGLRDELEGKVVVEGIDNNKWKSMLAYPETFKTSGDSLKVKTQVTTHILRMYPNLQVLEEDIMDAIGMGIGVHVKEHGPIWKHLKYNKKLSFEMQVLYDNPEVDELEEAIENKERKLRKVFLNAREVGGIREYDMQETMRVDLLIKQYLSYNDCLFLLRIHPNNRYHMMMLLLAKGHVKYLQEDETYTLMVARKKRK